MPVNNRDNNQNYELTPPSIKYGIIHCHSDNSINDSPCSPKQLVVAAKELGAPAIALTDHGVMSGIFELLRSADEVGIKAIPGVEAYVEESKYSSYGRMHLVLLAKNYDGYIAICKAVTESNTRIDVVPRMNFDILNRCFGKGSLGHRNVIATSACMGGILSSVLLQNKKISESIEKIRRKQEKHITSEDSSYLENCKRLDEYGKKVAELIEKRDTLSALANKKYAMRKKALSRLSGSEYEAKFTALCEEEKESQQAAERLVDVKRELASTKKSETAVRKKCKEMRESIEMYIHYQSEIDALSLLYKSDNELYSECVDMANRCSDIFGKDNFYVELQYHGIPEEAEVMPKLAQIAEELNLPMVASNDVHYSYNSKELVRARQLVSSLRFNKWFPPRVDETEYYIKTDEELTSWLCRILPVGIVQKAMFGIKDIVDKCNVIFSKETHFPKFINDGSETSSQRLRRLVEEGISKRYPNQTFKYRDRVEYELAIIEKMQYVDYLCIVQDYLEYGRKIGKENPEGVGYSIGPGRGSAAGSLVCYLIGITSIDPMEFDLLFERFLNPDRISSPDIDADLSKEVRKRVYDYVRHKYGEKAVCSIMTKGTAAGKKAIESVARIRGSELHNDTKYFFELGKEIKKHLPDANASLAKNKKLLLKEFAGNEDALSIINDALLIEGVTMNYGMHAAGVIIADNGNVGDYIPLMWNEDNEQWTTQCDMVEAEMQAGLLKFDFLGLKTLDIISRTLRYIKRNKGLSIDIEKVAYEKEVFEEIFASGKTNFVFQFESQGMKNMLRRFKPENIHHLVLLVAAYRPGPMQFIDPIIDIKKGKSKPTYICEAVKEILNPTFGYPIYQEQVMAICNKVAGFSLGEADTIRRYMSKKKEDEMAKYKPKFIDGLMTQDVDIKSAEEFWNQLMNFAQYGFNKSHAAAYATVAYYTAWLKYHYPAEFLTAVMNYNEDNDKLPMLVQECKMFGVQVLPPDINKSEEEYSCVDGNKIRFGLGNIKSVGTSGGQIIEERTVNGFFSSFHDFIRRYPCRKNVFESLVDAGALDLFSSNRLAMKTVYSDLKEYLDKIHKASIALETEENEQKRDNLNGKIKGYTDKFNHTIIPISIPESLSERLERERELLGMYASGHPLESYNTADIPGVTDIIHLESGKHTVCGIVSNLKVVRSKSDNKPMAFFEIEDATGSISAVCFSGAYSKYSELISEGSVISIYGKTEITENEDELTVRKIFVDTIHSVQKKVSSILISVPNLFVWTEFVYPAIKNYVSTTGLPAVLYDEENGDLRRVEFLVNDSILAEDIAKCKITLC